MLFALDLGNKQTKLYSSKTKPEGKVLPSYFLYNDALGNQDTSIFDKQLDLHTYKTAFDDEEYAWGADLYKTHAEDNFMDTIAFSKRYEQHEFKLLANFALAELASDYNKDILKVTVVTGVPSDDFNEASVKTIMKVLMGDHAVTRNDKDYIIRVEEVHVIPQSVGTVYSELIDNDGIMVEEKVSYLQEEIVVCDIGGGTVLIDVLKNMNLYSQTQFPTGIHEFYERVVTKAKENPAFNKLTAYDVERILRDYNASTGYFYKPNKNEVFEITEIVQSVKNKYTRETLNKINRILKSDLTIDTLLFTGGGANLIDRNIIKNKYERAIFVDNSEVANVIGFYNYGKAIELENADNRKEVAATEE